MIRGDVTATEQDEVDALVGVIEITGSLRLGSLSPRTPPLETLLPLRCLKSVGQRLAVGDHGLPTLAGLEALERVGDGVQIAGNGELTSLNGLHGLQSFGRFLAIINNSELADVASVRASPLDTAELFIYENPKLPGCAAERLAERLGMICSSDPDSNSPDAPIVCTGTCACTGNLNGALCD